MPEEHRGQEICAVRANCMVEHLGIELLAYWRGNTGI
jgi:hypothetical protein